jgi:two-component system nitrogen regulation response regulator NtrX
MGEPAEPLVLVVDDDDMVRRSLVDLLKARGHRTAAASTVGEGLRLFDEKKPAVVFLDLKLPDGGGLDVLREIQRRAPGTPVIVISGLGSVSAAVEAMQVGAADYVEKPVRRDELFEALERALGPGVGGGEGELERTPDGRRYGMVGASEAVRRVYQLIEMTAPARCRVLVTGERGSGKELVARALHALSPRRDRPLVQLNCAALPSELIESEMFGHVKGAFTGAIADRKGKFELASQGTLFLDEIGDMSLVAQVKLLRVLQEGEVTPVGGSTSRPVDVRVLAATSKNLPDEVRKGAFRDDLYDRLNVVNIPVPPLRNRREDIPELANHFLRLASVENDFLPKRLAPRAVELLKRLPWEGNVRELRNVMERLVVLVPRDVVTHKDVLSALRSEGVATDTESPSLKDARVRFERQYIMERLSANRWNLGHTARELGMERTNLYRKMKQLGIQPSAAARPAR